MTGFRLTLILLALGVPAGATAAQGVPAESAQPASFAAAAAQDSAQRPDERLLAVGDTVRVFGTGREPLRAVLRAVDSTSLSVEPLGTDQRTSIPRAQITRIETLRGHPRRGIRAVLGGAVIGGVAGALAGDVGARVKGEHGELVGIAQIAGGVLGAVLGTSVGLYAAFTRRDRWIAVDPNTLALQETP